MNNNSFNIPQTEFYKINVTSTTTTNDNKKKFENNYNFSKEQVTNFESNPTKNKENKKKSIKVTNWSIKLK